MKRIFPFVYVFLFISACSVFFEYYPALNGMSASVFFSDSTDTGRLRDIYNSADQKVKILIVAGHDDESFGTIFRGVKESELTLNIAEKLRDEFRGNDDFSVYLWRDKYGFNPEIVSYLGKNRNKIVSFVDGKKIIMENLVASGDIVPVDGIVHNEVPFDMAVRLYGINLWANENKIDLVIHVHFNDYPGRKAKREGKYSGFSIYVPEGQYSNAKTSKEVAKYVFNNLSRFYMKSDHPGEDDGIIEDQELIALGAFNTLDPAGMLIEYGYIYEDRFKEEKIKDAVFEDVAFQTYLGILEFFDRNRYFNEYWKTSLLPYFWDSSLKKGQFGLPVLSLQAALVLDGVFPKGTSSGECSISGLFGNCTEKGVKNFQKKYGITPTGTVGPRTLNKLNELYSAETRD